MTDEFNTLEEYAKCVLEYLKNVTHDYQISKDDRVKVVYATSPVAYAKAQENFLNGSNSGPLITFYQSGVEIKKEEQMGGWKVAPITRDEGNYLMRAPIICSIKYTVTINALTEAEADLLQYQIMSTSPFHRPYYTILNGQYVLIESTEFTNLGSVDTGENKDKISQRQITLTIDRAYLHYDIKELNAGIIKFTGTESSDFSSDDFEHDEEFSSEFNYETDSSSNEFNYETDSSSNEFNSEISDIENTKKKKKRIKVEKRLKNGVLIMSDGSIKNGEIIKNTSYNGSSPFNYNLADENGNIIGTTTVGKVKVTMYSIEGAKNKS